MNKIIFVPIGLLLFIIGCAPSSVSTATKTGSNTTAPALPEKTRIVNLEWKPTMKKTDINPEPLGVYKAITFKILSLTDTREDKRIIGKAYEDMKVRDAFVPIATRVNVAQWLRNGLNRVFAELGIKTDDREGNLILEIEIVEFFIFDDFTQTGSVLMRINARNLEGMFIWEGLIKGTSDLYVHAGDSDGISECLSNTMMVTIYNLLTDHSFRDAVKKAYE